MSYLEPSYPSAFVIRKNDHDEYEVPTGKRPDGELAVYYTDDREDARDTARYYAGVFDGEPEPHITWRRGSYNVEEA